MKGSSFLAVRDDLYAVLALLNYFRITVNCKKYTSCQLREPSKMTLLFFFFFRPDCNCRRPFLFSFDTPHCSILKKPCGAALSRFAFCERRCEGRFHVFSSPIKNTIQSFLLSFHTQNEVLTKMSLLRLFWVELKFKCL